MSEKKILVSGCLFGWHCRYDDGDTPCLHPQFLKWKEEREYDRRCHKGTRRVNTTATYTVSSVSHEQLNTVRAIGKDVRADVSRHSGRFAPAFFPIKIQTLSRAEGKRV